MRTKEFKEIIEKGQSIHGPFLIIRKILSKDSDKEKSVFGVSVPKKVAKTAVLRNKIRRRVYSIIRGLNTISGFKVIIIVKTGVEKLSFKDLSLEVEKTFVKSGLLK